MRHNQNRRSRGRNNRKGPNPLTRSYESNGPDVKVRGTAAHVADKYMTLARDAQSSGDTVAAENYLQHAEHYNRIVMAAQAQFQQSQPQFREGPDEGYDDDRQMNGRSRDRFDFNGGDGRGGEEEPGEERFDSSGEGDDDRGYRPPMQSRQQDHEQRSRGPRYDRFDRRDRQDRPDYRDNSGRPDRQDNRETGNRPERFQRADEPQPDLPPAPVETAPPAPEQSAAPPRRRRGRRSGAEQANAADSEDSTSDGAAALAAFPE
jgi:hypothetical protein